MNACFIYSLIYWKTRNTNSVIRFGTNGKSEHSVPVAQWLSIALAAQTVVGSIPGNTHTDKKNVQPLDKSVC